MPAASLQATGNQTRRDLASQDEFNSPEKVLDLVIHQRSQADQILRRANVKVVIVNENNREVGDRSSPQKTFKCNTKLKQCF